MSIYRLLLINFVLLAGMAGCDDQNTHTDDPEYYRILVNSSQGLYAFDPRNPEDVIQVDPELTSSADAFIVNQVYGKRPNLVEVDSYAVYIKNGRFYRINLMVGAQINPTQISNMDTADTYCSYSKSFPIQARSKLEDLSIDITLPGEDGECYNSIFDGNFLQLFPSPDNITVTINLGMSANDSPIVRSTRNLLHPAYGFGVELRSFTTDEETSYVFGKLTIEDQALYWYPDIALTDKQLISQGMISIFSMGPIYFGLATEGWIYLLQIDNELFTFNSKTAQLQKIHSILQPPSDMPLASTVKYTNSNSPLAYFIDDGIVFEIIMSDITQFQLRPVNTENNRFSLGALFQFSWRTPDVLIVEDVYSIYSVNVQDGLTLQLVPTGYQLDYVMNDYGLFSSIDTTLIVDWRAQEILRLDNTTVQQAGISGLGHTDAVVLKKNLGDNLIKISIFDVENLVEVHELGVIPASSIGDQWLSIHFTNTNYVVWSAENPSVLEDVIYITDLSNPNSLTEVLPNMPGKSLVN